MHTVSPPSPSTPSRGTTLIRSLVVVFLLAIATFCIAPNYFTDGWVWANPAKLPQTGKLNKVKENGLAVPGWNTLEQQTLEIGGHTWSAQAILPTAAADSPSPGAESQTTSLPLAETPSVLMLRPQSWHRDQPQVEWTDINGIQKWTKDQGRKLRFSVPLGHDGSDPSSNLSGDRSAGVNARYFRGWNRQQTYAVLQWYAWSTGGSSSASRWFWADQMTQLRDRQRMPWVAVTLMIPIKPLGDIESVRTEAEDLGKRIQTALIDTVFTPST